MGTSRDGSSRALVDRVVADPSGALAVAEAELAGVDLSDVSATANLRWVIGLALREMGRIDRGIEELESACLAAESAGDPRLAANIMSSWAYAVALQGDLDRALLMLRDAEPRVAPSEHGRLLGQIGSVLFWQGALTEAADTLVVGAAECERHGDAPGEIACRGNLGSVLSQLGRYTDARAECERVAAIAAEFGFAFRSAMARHSLGYIAALQGDLPSAIAEFVAAEAGLVSADARASLPQLFADHAQALADASLFDDADAMLHRALEMFESQGQSTELAGGLLTAAEIRLAKGDLTGATGAAERAAATFAEHGREPWAALASNIALHARARLARPPKRLAGQLTRAASTLERFGWPAEATRSRLLAARLAAERGASFTEAVDEATRLAVGRARPADRILLAHVDAIVASNRGDRGAARRAVTRGLNVAMSAQAALGSIETRAHAAIHGYGLAEVGARLAIADGRPRELLARIEATRLMTSRVPAVRPPDDAELARLLTDLRGVNATVADSASTAEQRAEAEQSRLHIERDIRRRSRAVRGDADAAVGVKREIDAGLASLGDRQLLAHAALDGRLFAVSVVDGRARLHELGDLGGVDEHVESIAFSLHRLNRQQGSEQSRLAAAELLYEIAAELSELLLPPIVAESFDPVVIVPTARLHDVPWGLLLPLGGRAVSVAPSVSAWAAAERTRRRRAAERRRTRRIGFLAGPGLEYAEFEVENLSAHYGDATVLTGAEASVDACLDLLGRADLVHAACHGSFRIDNPMFSSLELADGPLIVHDLERLRRMPDTVVLSACSVAGAKVLQGGSLLGLASALTTLGACSVIAPLTPISDAAAVTVMDRLHQQLLAGETPAAALAHATMAHDVTDPTAAAFVALGA